MGNRVRLQWMDGSRARRYRRRRPSYWPIGANGTTGADVVFIWKWLADRQPVG